MLTGCWTPPNANVQPPGEPRLIQGGVSAVDNNVLVTVHGVDASQRVLTLKLLDGTEITCAVNPRVKNLDRMESGDNVKLQLTVELALYVLKDGRLAITGGKVEAIGFNAKVQSVDPSYRLLVLHYPNGMTKVLKTGLNAKLLEMQAGDTVILQTAEAKSIRIEEKSVIAHEMDFN